MNAPTTARTACLAAGLAAGLAVACALPARAARAADAPAAPAAPSAFDEMPDEVRSAVDRGLKALADQQQKDGSISSGNYPVASTALAGLAFMCDGNLPGRGRYGAQVQGCVEFVVSCCTESGYITLPGGGDGNMYAHGFATLFLAEVYGESRDPKVREALYKAVNLLVKAQNNEGGWRYQPAPTDADLSVTVCQVKALRAAHNAGVSVPKETIDKAMGYVKKCQSADGGFGYTAGGGEGSLAMGAAGLSTLFYAGQYDGQTVDRGLKSLLKRVGGTDRRGWGGQDCYTAYYTAQALFMGGSESWSRFPQVRDRLVKSQGPNGLWSGGEGGAATGLALIALQMPYRLLPILQR